MRLAIICVLFVPSLANGENWPQFRGANGGKLAVIEHPTEWSMTNNIAWSIPMTGSGWSSPIVVGDRIFLTSAHSETPTKPKGMSAGVASMRSFRDAKPGVHRYLVKAIRLADGSEIWSRLVGESVPPTIHPSNTYATESPVSDGERLFTFFATTGTLAAWDFNGNEIWRRELGTYKSGKGFGTGSSLAMSDDLLFVQFDNDQNSFVAAFDAATGDETWRDNRPAKTSWSSPLIWNNEKGRELIACGSDVVTSYNPKDGLVNWRLSGTQSGFSGSPAVDRTRIYFGTSGPMSAGPLIAVKAGTTGDVPLDNAFQHDKVAWSRTKSGPGMASPVESNGCLYIPGSGGILNCYDAATGERLYRKRVSGMKTVVASLWADNQRVFLLDESGTTHIVKAGPTFELIRKNKIDDLFWSTPAVAGDSLILRGVDRLYCISSSKL